MILSFSIDNYIKEALIPKPPEHNCPPGTFRGIDTCYCEDHCSWKTCRLVNPPRNCLENIAAEAVWAWDANKNTWVAQGMIFKENVAFTKYANKIYV